MAELGHLAFGTLYTLPILLLAALSIWMFQTSIGFLETLVKVKSKAPFGFPELKPVGDFFHKFATNLLTVTKLEKFSSTAVEGGKVVTFTNIVLMAIVIVLMALLLEVVNANNTKLKQALQTNKDLKQLNDSLSNVRKEHDE